MMARIETAVVFADGVEALTPTERQRDDKQRATEHGRSVVDSRVGEQAHCAQVTTTETIEMSAACARRHASP